LDPPFVFFLPSQILGFVRKVVRESLFSSPVSFLVPPSLFGHNVPPRTSSLFQGDSFVYSYFSHLFFTPLSHFLCSRFDRCPTFPFLFPFFFPPTSSLVLPFPFYSLGTLYPSLSPLATRHPISRMRAFPSPFLPPCRHKDFSHSPFTEPSGHPIPPRHFLKPRVRIVTSLLHGRLESGLRFHSRGFSPPLPDPLPIAFSVALRTR